VLIAKGADIKTVQARMRHASARTTRLMVIYPLVLIADVATDICSSRARLRFASSTRIVVMCRMIEKGSYGA
jgi:hypothetical protein